MSALTTAASPSKGRGHIAAALALFASAPAGYGVCHTCPDKDNVWELEAFAHWHRAGEGRRPRVPCCNACLLERYPRVHRACATCGNLMAFHPARAHVTHPQCGDCRRSGAPHCARCNESTHGRATIDGMHPGCAALQVSEAA